MTAVNPVTQVTVRQLRPLVFDYGHAHGSALGQAGFRRGDRHETARTGSPGPPDRSPPTHSRRCSRWRALTQPSLPGVAQAQQANVVEHGVAEGVVGMKPGLGVGDRVSDAGADVLAGVADVVEQRALDILLHRRAENLAEQPVKAPATPGPCDAPGASDPKQRGRCRVPGRRSPGSNRPGRRRHWASVGRTWVTTRAGTAN